jgi:7-carboxy-7-deazaguanine synthase
VTLRVVETYASYQGEGPQTGEPTVFVRFAGCNLKCPGWPCDTQHAIDPKQFQKTQKFYTPDDLAAYVHEFGIRNICLTGGEVFLQHKGDLGTFISQLRRDEHHIEVFTNGTLHGSLVLSELINSFILDYKLPGSAETLSVEAGGRRHELLDTLGEKDAVKFTIADRTDYDLAKEVYERYLLGVDNGPQVYAGVVWDAMKTEELCKWMLEDQLPWKLNVQVHKYVWRPDAIGV